MDLNPLLSGASAPDDPDPTLRNLKEFRQKDPAGLVRGSFNRGSH